MNTSIYEEIINNSFMVTETYELIWINHFKEMIMKYANEIHKASVVASNADELYNIFKQSSLNNTTTKYFRKVFKPNAYMKACLGYLADIPATSAKYIIELYEDEIKNFNKARLYAALNILHKVHLIEGKVLPYVTPKPVTVWITPFAEKFAIIEAIDMYEADKIKFDQKQKKKELIITHNYNPGPKKESKKTLLIPCSTHQVALCKECE